MTEETLKKIVNLLQKANPGAQLYYSYNNTVMWGIHVGIIDEDSIYHPVEEATDIVMLSGILITKHYGFFEEMAKSRGSNTPESIEINGAHLSALFADADNKDDWLKRNLN